MTTPNLHLDKKGKKCKRGTSAFREGEASKESINLKLSRLAKDQLQDMSDRLAISRSEVIEQLLRNHSNSLILLLEENKFD